MTLAERFWTHVDTSGDCWPWLGYRNEDGYGQFVMPRKKRAHRVVWELTHGAIPSGLWVLHHCDNPPCVRPDHLFLGTGRDNSVDMIRKGRAFILGKSPRRSRGESHGGAKLTEAKVREIRQLAGTMRHWRLAEVFGVARPTITRIISRELWPHVK